MSYDQNSPDAMFSRILERMDRQDQSLGRIETAVNKTNGRVLSLERWRDIITAKVAMIAAGTSFIMGGIAWAIDRFV